MIAVMLLLITLAVFGAIFGGLSLIARKLSIWLRAVITVAIMAIWVAASSWAVHQTLIDLQNEALSNSELQQLAENLSAPKLNVTYWADWDELGASCIKKPYCLESDDLQRLEAVFVTDPETEQNYQVIKGCESSCSKRHPSGYGLVDQSESTAPTLTPEAVTALKSEHCSFDWSRYFVARKICVSKEQIGDSTNYIVISFFANYAGYLPLPVYPSWRDHSAGWIAINAAKNYCRADGIDEDTIYKYLEGCSL